MTQGRLKTSRSHRLFLVTITSFALGLVTMDAFASSSSGSEQIAAPQSQQSDVRQLSRSTPIERELAGGESHSYRVELTAGHYMHLIVEQKGIDVVVRLFGPDGKLITEVDFRSETQGPESVSAIAEAAGEYQVEVTALDKKAKPGRYKVKIEDLRAAAPKDRDRIAAERALGDAEVLRSEDTAESRRKAIEKYKEALPHLRLVDDRRTEALTLYRTGLVYGQLGENEKALEFYKETIPIWRELGDRLGEARTLHFMSVTYLQLGENDTALQYSSQTLPIWRATGNRQSEAATLSIIGLAYANLGKLRESLDYYNQGLALAPEVGNKREEAGALNNVGVAYQRLGEYQKALEYFDRALALARATSDRRREANTLHNIGGIHRSVGELEQALEYFNQALLLQRTTGDRRGEAFTLSRVGDAYSQLGQPEKALEYYNQALLLRRNMKEIAGVAVTLRQIGNSYSLLGQPQTALKYYYEALPLHRSVGDRPGEARTLSNIGDGLSLLAQPEEALKYLDQAVALHRSVGDQGAEATTLKRLSRVERDGGHLDRAFQHIGDALNIIESLRAKFTSQELRTSFSASRQDFYSFYIDLLMQIHKREPSAGHDAAALKANERARARSLLEMLTETRADIRQGVDALVLERERSLQQQLSTKADLLTKLLSSKHSEEQEAVARKEVEALLKKNEEVAAQIRAESPHYAALTQPQPLSLEEIQRRVLDDNTLLLEYALGEERSYLWAVTPNSMTSFELPKRSEIEAAARRVHEALTARNKTVRFEKPEQRRARVGQADAEYLTVSARLTRMLLEPVGNQLGRKRLLIVSEGALQYVPFGALPEPIGLKPASRNNQVRTNNYRPLMLEHEIVSLPSSSVLAAMRSETAKGQRKLKTVAVLADPVFQEDDPRVHRARMAPTEKPKNAPNQLSQTREVQTSIERSARDVGEAQFRRLPYSRREAETIAAMVPKGMRKESLDFDANLTTVMSDDLSNYRIIHFATHGLVNSVHPDLSGIVLSLVDEDGHPKDGFLRLPEIYNLKLRADLVVLSACRTALGKDVKGEGLIGLTRGFMYAGAPRVIASLWGVDDETTADLMKKFYREMLIKGQRPAAALRAAQIGIWQERRLPPYYWGAFVLQGEWQ